MSTQFVWPPSPDQHCFCGRDRPFSRCCLAENGLLRKLPEKALPGPPRTKFRHPDCYLNSLRDCSQKISAEHYISKGVLDVIGEKISVSGTPWLKGATRIIGKSNLTSKILCERHNSAFSSIDSEMKRFVQTLLQINTDLHATDLNHPSMAFLFSGNDIEAWMLKTLLGMLHSGNATGMGISLRPMIFAQQRIKHFLNSSRTLIDSGLYFSGGVGQEFRISHEVSFAPITSDKEARILGARFSITGLNFWSIFDDFGINIPGFKEERVYKPSSIEFNGPAGRRILLISWPNGTAPQHIQTKLQ